VVGVPSLRVLDLSSVGPASRAAGIFADYGATVTKVLRPRDRIGDAYEAPPSAYGGAQRVRQLRIDLTDRDGRDVLLRLADGADVVLESYRPGVAQRLGIDAAVMRARNRRLVHCSITGYGTTGDYANWAGHDLNYVGLAGMLAHGEPRADGGPPVPGATVADGAGGGMHAVIAVLVALLARERTGEGATLDVSVADGALWLMSLVVDQHLATGLDDGPMRLLTGDYGCYSNYRARDGRWLSVAALEHRFWRNLCVALDLEELVPMHTEATAQAEVKQRLTTTFATRDRDEWVAQLGPADTCVAPVHAPQDVASDPHFRSRGVVREHRLAPLLAGSAPASPPTTDADDDLREAGLAQHEIDDLRTRRIVE
jgi:alpha-methylacyl-CoA racemase